MPREAYEGAGGWRDGRLGQANDILETVLRERRLGNHAVLAQIVALDVATEELRCPHADPFNYCETCPVTPCPVGLS